MASVARLVAAGGVAGAMVYPGLAQMCFASPTPNPSREREGDSRAKPVTSPDIVLAAVTGAGTTPQVYIEGQRIGGADELTDWLKATA